MWRGCPFRKNAIKSFPPLESGTYSRPAITSKPVESSRSGKSLTTAWETLIVLRSRWVFQRTRSLDDRLTRTVSDEDILPWPRPLDHINWGLKSLRPLLWQGCLMGVVNISRSKAWERRTNRSRRQIGQEDHQNRKQYDPWPDSQIPCHRSITVVKTKNRWDMPAITHRYASMQALSIDETLDVARYRLTKKSEHLSNRERHPHPMRTVGMTCNKAP